MKYVNFIIVIIVMMNLAGCASTGFLMVKPVVTLFGETYPAKSVDAKIEVFSTIKPDRKYTEMAQIKCEDSDDTWNIEQILMKARAIGADAIIITGKTGSYGVGVPIGTMTYAEVDGYGISAIAIKYK
jgi:hypothetical protein